VMANYPALRHDLFGVFGDAVRGTEGKGVLQVKAVGRFCQWGLVGLQGLQNCLGRSLWVAVAVGCWS
jgi:hypothetical protein